MRVRVDPELCDAFGICATHAPNVFKLDEWGFASVEQSDIPHGEEEAVWRAVFDCPMHAIQEENE